MTPDNIYDDSLLQGVASVTSFPLSYTHGRRL